MKKRVLIILLLFLGINNLYAQNIWTLEECIQYAIDHNIQVKQQALNSEYQKNQLLSSKLSILPSVNASAYESLRFGRNVDPYTNEFTEDNSQSFNSEISAQMNLFNGGQRYHEIRKSNLNLQISLKDLEKAENDIAVNIANAFFNVLYNEELLDVSIAQLETTRSQVENTEKLVNAGSLAQGNLLEVQSQLANEELQVVNAENALNLAYLTLTQYMELDSVSGFRINRPLIDPIQEATILPEVNQVFAEAKMIMPEIQSSELNSFVAQKDLSLARSSYYPSLVLSASYGSGYSNARKEIDQIIASTPVLIGYGIDNTNGNLFDVYQYGFDYTYRTRPFSDQFRDNASASVSIGLSIPLFNGWQVKTAVNNAKINLETARYNEELTRKQLYREIQQAYADASAAMKKYIATKKALEAMRESFRYTQQRFDVGLVTSVDYNISKNQLNQTESELIRAKYEFVFKSKILDFYRGQPITLSQ
jgi:outer membrane protein